VLRRRNVYRHRLYSPHVGSNRLSGFRSVTPTEFARSDAQQSRARNWLRRELRVFDHLQKADSSGPSHRWHAGQIRNVEFLLEYIVQVLKVHAAKDGAPEVILKDYFGDDTPLFLHELNSWLRSPFTSLEDWDRFVYHQRIPSWMETEK
jgi:hypothetical protein